MTVKKPIRVAALMAGASLFTVGLGGCATTCGSFDTEQLRADLKAPFRTDREWHESLIQELAWQLDCERRVTSADF